MISKKSNRNSLFFFLCLAFLACGPKARADVINVPAGGDIQAAINAVSVGGTVNLAPGNYPLTNQIYINKSLTLNGAGIDVSIILSPDTVDLVQTMSYSGPTPRVYTPVVIVENAATVVLQNFTVNGRDQSVFGVISDFTGVGYHNTSGTLSNLHVLNIMESTEPTGYQEGFGIVDANDTGTNTITIQNCVVDHFQKAGIQAIGPGLTFTIDQNTVIGVEVEANPNGIEAYDGSIGAITNNTCSNLINPLTTGCSGILIFDAPSITIENNTLNAIDNGIYLFDCNNATVNNNTLTNNINSITVDDTTAVAPHTFHLNNNTMSDDTSLSSTTTFGVLLYSPTAADINPQVFMDSNTMDSATYGLVVNGNTTDTAGPIVSMHNDTFLETYQNSTYYIQMVSCPNDIWPTTRTVSFNGLVTGGMTLAQFDALVLNPTTQQIYDKNTDPTLGLVLVYVPIASPTLTGLSTHSGSFAGGTQVTITGTNFIRGAQVYFGGVLATDIDVINDTTIIVTSPPGSGTVSVTVTTTNGTSPVNPAGDFTYTGSSAPLPPANFVGRVKKNVFLNQKEYFLTATWDASPSTDIVAYRIYYQSSVIEEIPASSPYVFSICLKSKSVPNYQIAAVSADGSESALLSLRVQ